MLTVVMLKPIILINKDGHVIVFPGVLIHPGVAAETRAS
jgi:hypothetical protein